jgi:hypothetical protein
VLGMFRECGLRPMILNVINMPNIEFSLKSHSVDDAACSNCGINVSHVTSVN